MKLNRLSAIARPITLASLAVATFALAGVANAQYKAVGEDGIAASPKVRQMLNERKASATPTVAAASTMACPKCADVRTTEINRQTKGASILAGAATKVLVKHTCPACEIKWTVVGEGKTKHSVATHKCTADVPNNLVCCATK